jgi:hypothetical protein
MGTLFPSVPLAISSFHGYCLDLSRRLYEGRITQDCNQSRCRHYQRIFVRNRAAKSQRPALDRLPAPAAGIREVEKWQLRSDVHFSMLRGGTSCGVSGYSESARAALSITFATSLGCEM